VRQLPTPVAASQGTIEMSAGPAEPVPPLPPVRPADRPVIRATSPKRFRVQFTIGQGTHDRLRRLQNLLRREIPSGDPAAIFDRAVVLLLDQVERKKLGAPAKPACSRVIRPGTDKGRVTALEGWQRTPMRPSRYVPRPVRRAVYERDGGRCTFVSDDGRTCTEQAYIDFHHGDAHARGGLPTIPNMTLHCWRHNQYERDRVFGPRHVIRKEP